MSVTRITSLHCDICGGHVYVDMGSSVSELRSILRSRGWRVNLIDPEGGRMRLDVCPKHSDPALHAAGLR